METLKNAIFKYKKCSSDVFFQLEEAQQVLLDIMSDFQRFCDDNDIKFSLTYGSLLGALREHNIIKWDDDIDLMMDKENVNKIMGLLNELPKYNLKAYHYSMTKHIYTNEIRIYRDGYYRLLNNNGKLYLTPLCIDIFPFEKISIPFNKKQNDTLEKISKYKKILILKESKYNSKNVIRGLLRSVKKTLYFWFSSNRLHKSIDEEISKLYYPGSDYELFSPFANETFLLRYNKSLLNNVKKIDFGNLKVCAIEEAPLFLSMVYGDWEIPHDRSNGKVNEAKFIKRIIERE